ncbi:MAG: FAD binding domain-containing protein [Acidobacteria bacterium]|nr:FAD binding domain-containing protein [Acidobacteriota bacterium]
MMRLPDFRFFAPTSVREAAELLAASSGDAMLIAGGTDLLPNMKRRQQVPGTLVGLRRVAELRSIANGDGLTIGAGMTLTELVRDTRIRQAYGVLWQAAAQVATPHLRNMGTLGGNLCLDTRCNYYDQSFEWRKAIDFCMKKDGETCWVATSSPKCLAVSSTDTAPALLALNASVTLVSADATRRITLSDLYRNDGIHYLTRKPTEILTAVHVPPLTGWRSTYWKLRRRGAFDFPVLSVAAAVKMAKDGTVEAARIVLGAVTSRPVEAPAAAAALMGQRLTDDIIWHVADLAAQPSRPMDNTDFSLVWRKRMTKVFVTYALRELRGDDMRGPRLRVSRQELL